MKTTGLPIRMPAQYQCERFMQQQRLCSLWFAGFFRRGSSGSRAELGREPVQRAAIRKMNEGGRREVR